MRVVSSKGGRDVGGWVGVVLGGGEQRRQVQAGAAASFLPPRLVVFSLLLPQTLFIALGQASKARRAEAAEPP